MFVATIIVSALLAVMLLGSGTAKATRNPKVVEGLTKVGFPDARIPLLALPLYAGAVGLIVGLWVAPLGIAAAIGVIFYFVLAIGAHVRAKDPAWQGPAVFLVAGVAALVLRILSA